MYILITARVDEEDDVDRAHGTGLTNAAWQRVTDALMDCGFDDVDVQAHPIDEAEVDEGGKL